MFQLAIKKLAIVFNYYETNLLISPLEKCVRVHHDLPYKWEILDEDGETWKPFPNEEDVEKAYCDPANDTRYFI